MWVVLGDTFVARGVGSAVACAVGRWCRGSSKFRGIVREMTLARSVRVCPSRGWLHATTMGLAVMSLVRVVEPPESGVVHAAADDVGAALTDQSELRLLRGAEIAQYS